MEEGTEIDDSIRPLVSRMEVVSDALFLILVETMAWAVWYWVVHPVNNLPLFYTVSCGLVVLAVFTYWFTVLHYRSINRLHEQRVRLDRKIYEPLREHHPHSSPPGRYYEIGIRGRQLVAKERPDIG
jgi:hypothetical protein